MNINKKLDNFDKSKLINEDLYLIIEKEDKDTGESRWAWIDIDKPCNDERSKVVVYGDAWEDSGITYNAYTIWQQLYIEEFEDYFDTLMTLDKETGLCISLRIVHKENKVDQVGMKLSTKKLDGITIYLYHLGKTINMTEEAKIAYLGGMFSNEIGFGDLINNVRVSFGISVKMIEFGIDRVIKNWDYRQKTWFDVNVDKDTAFEIDAKAAMDVKTSIGNKKKLDIVDCIGRPNYSYSRSTFRDPSIYKEPTELRLKLGKKVFLRIMHDEYGGIISMIVKAHHLKPGDFKIKITCIDETETTEENKGGKREIYEIDNVTTKNIEVADVGNWLIRYDIGRETVNIHVFNKDYTCMTI